MATTTDTRQLITQPVMQGADKYASDAKKVGDALKGMGVSAEQAAKSSERVGTSSEKQRRELVSTANAVDRVMNRVSAASRLETQFARDIELVNRALNTGAIGAQRHAQAVGAIEQSHRRAMEAVKRHEEAANRGGAALNRMSGALGQMQTMLAGVGAALGVRQLIEYADTWTRLEGRLRLVTKTTDELTNIQGRLFDSAQRTRSSFEGTVDLYTRVARNAEQLGLSQQRLLDLTETVNQAIRVGGSTATEATAGVIQFGQAIASGVLRGDEFKSIMENMPGLAEALRGGLNKTTGELRKMAEAGELTANVVVGAIEKMRDKVARDFALLPQTVGESFTQLQNSALKYIGALDDATGGTSKLGGIIQTIAQNFDAFAVAVIGVATAMSALKVATLAATGALAANPLTAIIAGVAALAGGIWLLVEAWGGLTGATRAAAEEAAKAAEAQRKLTDEVNGLKDKYPVAVKAAEDLARAYKTHEVAAMRVALAEKAKALAMIDSAVAYQQHVVDPGGEIPLNVGRPLNVEAARAEAEKLRLEMDRLRREIDAGAIAHIGAQAGAAKGPVGELSKEAKKLQTEIEKLDEKVGGAISNIGKKDIGGAAGPIIKLIEAWDAYEKKVGEVRAATTRLEDVNEGFDQGLRALNRTLVESREKLAEQNAELEFQNRVLRLEIEGTGDTATAVAALTKARTIENLEKQKSLALSEKLAAIQEVEARADDETFSGTTGGFYRRLLGQLQTDAKLTTDLFDKMISETAINEDLKLLKQIQDEASGPMTEVFKNAARSIQSAMSDTFRDVLDGGVNSFKDLGSSILNIMKEVAAQIAALMVFRPVMGGVLGAFGASPDFIRQLGGSVSSGGGSIFSGIGNAISGAGNWVSSLFGGGAAAGAAGLGSIAAAGGGGAALGVAGMPAGMLGAELAGSGASMFAGLGAAVPYIGAGLAAAAIIAPMLFKKKPSVGPGQAATLQQSALELEILRAAADNGGSVSTAQQYGRGAISGFNDLFEAMGGGRFTTGTGFNIGNNQKEGFSYALYAPGQTPGSYDNTTEAKNLASAEEAVTQAFLAAMEAGLVEGLSDTFKTAFDAVKPTTTEELQDIVGRVKQYEEAIKPALDMLDPANSGLGQALKASADAFDALIESATELGLAIDPLSAKAAEAAQAIRDGFVRGLEQQARAATGRGYIDQLLGFTSAATADELSNLQFANDPAAMAYNQGLINTRFAGQVGGALQGMNVDQLRDVVAFFGESTTSTGIYITALANQLIELGGAAEEATGGITEAGQKLLDQLGLREMRLAGNDRGAIAAEGAIQKAEQLAAALAEGFSAEQLARLATVIDGELNKALADFDAALVQAAEAAAEAARQVEAEALAKARASRDFDADLTIREARLGGNNRGALELELAAQKIAAIEAAEAAGRTAEQIARLAAVLDGEAAKALADFDAQLGGVTGSVDAATDALRRFNEDLQVRASALGSDELATALLQFDINAQRQREEAAAIAGADLAALEQVLAGERAKIIQDYNDRLAEEAARAQEAALRAQEQAAEEQRRLQEEAARAAEEAAQKIADAMRAAAELNDSLEVRLLRAQGLTDQADRLDLVKRQQREMADALELRNAGGNPNIDLLKIVQALELANLGKQSVGVSRGSFYDPAAYDPYFTQAASASLIGAGRGLRGMDLLTTRAINAGTSNVIGVAGDGDPTRGPGPGGATSFDDIRPLTSLTVGEWTRQQDRIVTPLMQSVSVLTEIRDLIAEQNSQQTGGTAADVLREILNTLGRMHSDAKAQGRTNRRDGRYTPREAANLNTPGFRTRRARGGD